MSNANKNLALFVSCSFAALLIATGAPAAFAGTCQVSVTNNPASGPVDNAGAINCIDIENSTVNGSVANVGTINANGAMAPTQTGIGIKGSTINGSIVDSGTINATSHGIL
jgi:hypothetical protein